MCALNLAAENRTLKEQRHQYAEQIDRRIAQLAASLD